MSLEAWLPALDALEEQNRRREAYLDGRGPLPEEVRWQRPEGPLPPELRERALALVAASQALEARVRQRLAGRPATGASPYSTHR